MTNKSVRSTLLSIASQYSFFVTTLCDNHSVRRVYQHTYWNYEPPYAQDTSTCPTPVACCTVSGSARWTPSSRCTYSESETQTQPRRERSEKHQSFEIHVKSNTWIMTLLFRITGYTRWRKQNRHFGFHRNTDAGKIKIHANVICCITWVQYITPYTSHSVNVLHPRLLASWVHRERVSLDRKSCISYLSVSLGRAHHGYFTTLGWIYNKSWWNQCVWLGDITKQWEFIAFGMETWIQCDWEGTTQCEFNTFGMDISQINVYYVYLGGIYHKSTWIHIDSIHLEVYITTQREFNAFGKDIL